MFYTSGDSLPFHIYIYKNHATNEDTLATFSDESKLSKLLRLGSEATQLHLSGDFYDTYGAVYDWMLSDRVHMASLFRPFVRLSLQSFQSRSLDRVLILSGFVRN